MASKETDNTPAVAPIDYTAALRGAGLLEERQVSDIVRLKLNGNNFYIDDDLVAVYNPITKEPALRVQIVDVPTEYQAMWFDEDGELADAVGRPEIAGKMCRSYFDIPTQNRKQAEDGTECRSCPVNPFQRQETLPREAKGSKCKWRGDLKLRLLNPDGSLKDEQIYTMSMSFTSMVEWKGISRDPEKGYTRDLNFMQMLVRLGEEKAGGDDESRNRGVMKAMTALRLGGVIAEIRAPQQKLQNGNTFNVISFTPIDILEIEEQPALTGDDAPLADQDGDPIPF